WPLPSNVDASIPPDDELPAPPHEAATTMTRQVAARTENSRLALRNIARSSHHQVSKSPPQRCAPHVRAPGYGLCRQEYGRARRARQTCGEQKRRPSIRTPRAPPEPVHSLV